MSSRQAVRTAIGLGRSGTGRKLVMTRKAIAQPKASRRLSITDSFALG